MSSAPPPGPPHPRSGTQTPRVWRLSELELFADLTPAELDRIGTAAPMRQVDRGELLYGPHRPAEVLFILKAGRIRLYRTAADGRSLTTSIVVPGELFGAMPTLGQRMEATFAEVLDPGVVCVMSRQDVERLLLTDLRIVTRITEALGARIGELERRLSDTVLLPVPARICSTLATLAGSPPVSVRLTHEQLADLVGSTRETVTKVLGELRERHLVRLRRGRIDVLDPVRLLELAT